MKKILVSSLVAALLPMYVWEYLLWRAEDRIGAAGSFYRWLEVRAKRKDILPLLTPNQYASLHPGAPFVPLSGPAGVWMLGVNENGYWPEFKTDEFGFNNPSGRHAMNPDFVLIGDSFTQGTSVNPAENLAGQLASSGFRVVNLGQDGSGPILEWAILRVYGMRLHPKNVVWFFFAANDFSDLRFEKTVSAYSKWSGRDADSATNVDRAFFSQQTDEAWSAYLKSQLPELPRVKHRNMLRFLRLARVRTMILWDSRPVKASDEEINLVVSIVERARAESEGAGANFTFVYLPPTGREAMKRPFNEEKAPLLDALRRAGIRVVDFGEAIARSPDPDRLTAWGRRGGHYNGAGYKLLAETVSAAVCGISLPCPNPR